MMLQIQPNQAADLYLASEIVEEASFDSGEEQDTMWDCKDQFRDKKVTGRRQGSKVVTNDRR